MSKFKSNYKIGEIEIPTAALPDIIFMLLFFFMVTTVPRVEDKKMKYMIPDAEQIKKIEKKSLVSEIIIGYPVGQRLGVEPKIQIDNRFVNKKDIIRVILEKRMELPDYQQNQQIVLLKADKAVQMVIIMDLQQELRKANTRKIVYATLQNVP